MKEPVLCSDGHYYEKDAILEYLKNFDKSPITREKFEIIYYQKDVVNKIKKYLEKNKELKNDQYQHEVLETQLEFIFLNKEDYILAFRTWLIEKTDLQKKRFITNMINKQEQIEIKNNIYNEELIKLCKKFKKIRSEFVIFDENRINKTNSLNLGDFLLFFNKIDLYKFWNDSKKDPSYIQGGFSDMKILNFVTTKNIIKIFDNKLLDNETLIICLLQHRKYKELYVLLVKRQILNVGIEYINVNYLLDAIDKQKKIAKKLYRLLKTKYSDSLQKNMKKYFLNLYQFSDYFKLKELENENIIISFTKYLLNFFSNSSETYFLVFIAYVTALYIASIIDDTTRNWPIYTKLSTVYVCSIITFFYFYSIKYFITDDNSKFKFKNYITL